MPSPNVGLCYVRAGDCWLEKSLILGHGIHTENLTTIYVCVCMIYIKNVG